MRFVTRFAPEYLELLREAQRANGWRRVVAGIAKVRRGLNIDGYVALYDSEKHLYGCFVVGVLGVQEMKELDAPLRILKPAELQDELNALNESVLQSASDEVSPESEEEAKAAAAELNALSEPERGEAIKRIQYFWCTAIAFFYNTVSVMVHGDKLTSLVPKTINGDQTKNGTPRGVPLNRDAVAVLEGERGKHGEYCFTFRGKPIRYELTNTAWQNAVRKAIFASTTYGIPGRPGIGRRERRPMS